MIEEFLEAQSQLKRPGVTGWWDRVLPELDEQQRASLIAAAKDSAISHRAICIVLGRWGHDVSREKVAHWRRTRVA